ncbi:hypothetical protein BpHYR1_037453 [Brachionus plicatilis]|uniref:Uncharacterized protein n=1 Tax=Brachionus plicatilis TaxID=10195 RepID=A0A3M7SFY0_BRAPC|nr:hypothetical protein BpHYR1_037453 [Brachionus plicatilis]
MTWTGSMCFYHFLWSICFRPTFVPFCSFGIVTIRITSLLAKKHNSFVSGRFAATRRTALGQITAKISKLQIKTIEANSVSLLVGNDRLGIVRVRVLIKTLVRGRAAAVLGAIRNSWATCHVQPDYLHLHKHHCSHLRRHYLLTLTKASLPGLPEASF